MAKTDHDETRITEDHLQKQEVTPEPSVHSIENYNECVDINKLMELPQPLANQICPFDSVLV